MMVTHQKACSQKGTCMGFFSLITTSPQMSLEPVAGDPDDSPGTFRPLVPRGPGPENVAELVPSVCVWPSRS